MTATHIKYGEEDLLLQAVTAIPGGASLQQIVEKLPVEIPRRTVQRKLAQMVQDVMLNVRGKGRWSRYSIPIYREFSAHWPQSSSRVREEPIEIPLSAEALDIRSMVREPLERREPAGYRREFLDAYRPNMTRYLPQEVRDRLVGMGKGPREGEPPGTHVRRIFNRLLIDLSWNSSRLEGNTYSLLETERLLQLGKSADGKEILEAQMILNHKDAIEMLVEQAGEIAFNRYTICNLHAMLAYGLLLDSNAEGRVRVCPVGITGTKFHPLVNPQQVDECFDQVLRIAEEIEDPFEQSFFVMVHLPYLQPFEDVNKRVSRMAANIPLIRNNLCPLSFVDLPSRVYVDGILGVYEFNRIELLRDAFVWAYERSCGRYSEVRVTLGDPDPLRVQYREALREMIGEIVRAALNKQAATAWLRKHTTLLAPPSDVARLMELAETELMGLHEGNIARYKLRPSEYHAWKLTWE